MYGQETCTVSGYLKLHDPSIIIEPHFFQLIVAKQHLKKIQCFIFVVRLEQDFVLQVALSDLLCSFFVTGAQHWTCMELYFAEFFCGEAD